MFYSLGQSYDSTYPRVLMLAINYNGVFLLDWKTKVGGANALVTFICVFFVLLLR
jgi:hypothetical protein